MDSQYQPSLWLHSLSDDPEEELVQEIFDIILTEQKIALSRAVPVQNWG
jgi:hypothetical protein